MAVGTKIWSTTGWITPASVLCRGTDVQRGVTNQVELLNSLTGGAGCPWLCDTQHGNSLGQSFKSKVQKAPHSPVSSRHRRKFHISAASRNSSGSVKKVRSTSTNLKEASGEIVFQRHRSKTKFQYASSLERLALARLSSKESREAAIGLGIENVGEQETPVCVGFTVIKEGRGDLRLEGAVDTALEVPCARCAIPIGVPIEGPFNLLLTAKPLRVVGRTVVGIVRGRKDQELDDLEEAENIAGALEDEAYDLDLDDKKYFPAEMAEIDLSEYIRETILLKVPLRVLCKEDCKGLCIDCGADWNKESCSCARKRDQTQEVAPKTNWGSALAQFRDQLRE